MYIDFLSVPIFFSSISKMANQKYQNIKQVG